LYDISPIVYEESLVGTPMIQSTELTMTTQERRRVQLQIMEAVRLIAVPGAANQMSVQKFEEHPVYFSDELMKGDSN